MKKERRTHGRSQSPRNGASRTAQGPTPPCGDVVQALPLLEHVKFDFQDAVDLACQTEQLQLKFTSLYNELKEESLLSKYPTDILRLLVHILKKQEDYLNHQFELPPLYQALKTKLSANQILPLTNEMIRLGLASAFD